MKKMLRKVLMLMVGVAFSSVSYASMVISDTIVSEKGAVYVPSVLSEYVSSKGATIDKLYVDEITTENGSVSISNVTSDNVCARSVTVKKEMPSDPSPVFNLYSTFYSQDPVLKVSFDESNIHSGPTLSTRTSSHGYYWVPINFEASEYNFNFGGGEGAVMNVNGKIVCKDELKVAEVNTDKIRAKDIDVDFNNAADYVFADDYELKPLSEVEAYVKENKHLPGVPSADEFSNQGMNVSKMSNLLLEKVEELTLHVIQLQKEIEMLKADNEALRNGK